MNWLGRPVEVTGQLTINPVSGETTVPPEGHEIIVGVRGTPRYVALEKLYPSSVPPPEVPSAPPEGMKTLM
ncbi:MAG: hypothetical protein IPO77_21805 [Acidobacteria bacterium]|nr:hypothetical protein [Acidobacteriota bacterium]